jgi:hypothetical protein
MKIISITVQEELKMASIILLRVNFFTTDLPEAGNNNK